MSVALTFSWIARNSFRSASRACASASKAAFVTTFGRGMLTFGFGAILRAGGFELSSFGVFEAARSMLTALDVAADSSAPWLSSSSSPRSNDSLLLTGCFAFFFFFGGCCANSLSGVAVLYLAHQFIVQRWWMNALGNLPFGDIAS